MKTFQEFILNENEEFVADYDADSEYSLKNLIKLKENDPLKFLEIIIKLKKDGTLQGKFWDDFLEKIRKTSI